MINWIKRWYDEKHAIAAATLLERMSDGQPHGAYELSRQKPRIGSGMVYAALRRLEETGLVEGVIEPDPGHRPPRRLYRKIDPS